MPDEPFGRVPGEIVIAEQMFGSIVTVYSRSTTQLEPFASWAISLKVKVPAVVGAPASAAMFEEGRSTNERPGGKESALKRKKVYGGVPPFALMYWLYALPTIPLGK